ncbi:MAG: AsmA-like C-terminal region-containing protein [Desulfobacterales bacterium]|nr:AsmA-like C-terminal region-containing protein [Desulfobacterales bacterium]
MILSSKTGIKKIVFYGIALILILLISSPFIINRVINTSYIKNKISFFIHQKTGANIDSFKFSITVFPQAGVNIENFNFTPDNRTNVNIKILKFDIDMQKLLRGKINIDQITIDRPMISTTPLKEKPSASPIDFPVSRFAQNFKKVFAFLPEHQESVELTLKDIKFNPHTFSNASFEKNPDFESIELDQLKCIVKFSAKGSYQIDIKPFKLNYPDGLVAIHFEDNQIQKKTRIQFTGTNIHIGQAREMSLLLFKDNKISKSIFKILHDGIAPQVNVSFQGKELKDLFSGNHLTLKGNIEDGLVHIPQTDLIASRVSGNAHIHNGILDINTNNATIQSSKIGKGRLSIDLLNHIDFPFQGEFSLDVDLSMIPQTLISLLPDTLLAKELSLVHNVTGRAKTRLNLSLETKSSDLKVKINTKDFSVFGKYDRIPGDITLENVNFDYEPDMVYLKRLNGVINGSTIYDLNTVLDFKDEVQIGIRSGSGMIDLDSMIPWLMSYEKTKQMISPVKGGSGQIYITSIDLAGPILKPDLWEYDLKGMGVGIDVTTNFLNHKQIENLSCQYHISDDLLNLKTIQMKMNDLSWMEHLIEKKYLDSISVPFDMEKGDFHIGIKNSLFKAILKFGGGPELYIDLKGETPASLTLNSIKFIDQGLSNGSIFFNYNNDKPLFDFDGILDTATLSKVVIPDSYWSKKINALTEGQSILIYKDRDSVLNIITKNADLNSLISHSKEFSSNTRLLSDEIINFKADQLKAKNLIFTNVDSKLSFKKALLYAKLEKALLCDLEISGYINLKKDTIYADFPFNANNKTNIQDLLTCLFQKNDFMDGRYSLKGNLLSSGSKKDFLNKFTGSLIFNADEGRIYKLTLLSRILSVLNVSKIFKGKIPNVTQDGFAYKNISIEADIKDSIIYLKKAIIDGQDMALIFSGWIDPINDKIDLTCLVAPFKTVDLIIEHIPIINTLLEGRLVSVPVKATGKLSDPIAVPLHPSSVGKSLINMMSNILKTPVKLWDKVYSE